jgi:hypothetical protein
MLGRSTIFTERMPKYLVVKKLNFKLASKFYLPRILTIPNNEQSNTKGSITKYLTAHSFYSVDELYV